MLFEVKRSFLLRNGSLILRSTKIGICSKQAVKGFKSQSNCVDQRKLLNSSRPFAAFYNSERYFFQSFCRWQSQCDAEANSDANASSVMAENVKNKRLVDLFESLSPLKSDRQKIARELNFPDDLLDELITHTELYINKDDIDKTLSSQFFANFSFKPHSQSYNFGDAFLMAKIAFAYLRLGLSPDQIGFILPPSLDAQPSVLFCLFRHHFHLTDGELNKLSIGKEIDFLDNEWRPREVVIYGSPLAKKAVEDERMASSPSSSSLQHVMIGSEREFNQKCKSELAQQRVIKDSSFVISANKFATRDELNAAKLLVDAHHIDASNNDFETLAAVHSDFGLEDLPFPTLTSANTRRRYNDGKSSEPILKFGCFNSQSEREPRHTALKRFTKREKEFGERQKNEFEPENEQLRKINAKLQREMQQLQETNAELQKRETSHLDEIQRLNKQIRSLYERMIKQQDDKDEKIDGANNE